MKVKLSKQEIEKIESAIKVAEAHTSGQIVARWVGTSADYGYVAHRVALFFTIGWGLLCWLHPMQRLLFWHAPTLLLSLCLAWGSGWVLGQWPWLIRLMVGKKRMRFEVRESAMASFVEYGVHRTKARNGVLLYVSQLEHKVQLIADEGIHEKVGEATWNSITTEIASGLQKKAGAEALVTGIRAVGAVLEKHFPGLGSKENEISDHLRR